MLLRIEVFQPEVKGSSKSNNDDANRIPSQILYCSPSTVANRLGANGSAANSDANDDRDGDGDVDADADDDDDATVDSSDLRKKQKQKPNPNAGLVARIGRKGDVDVLFGTDRSISREHALLRFVGIPSQSKSGTKPKPRTSRIRTSSARASNEKDKNENNDNINNINKAWCFEPRNDKEAAACKTSPYGMCLVLENKGKSGSYVASEDTSSAETNDSEEAGANLNANANEDSDATTDDETGANSNRYRHCSRANPGTAASLATQTGEILVSRKNLAPSQSLPSLSGAVQHYFGSDTPVRLTKIDAGESHVLSLGNDGNGNGNGNDRSSVLVQFGIAQLPTIKITLVPMTVVFSSGVPALFQDSLRLCGGLVQESGTLPRNDTKSCGKKSLANANTTHLVTTERKPVAKQLIAWCYEIPIVSPDYLGALRKHSDLSAPFPDPAGFPPPATDTMDFWESLRPARDLLSGYVVLSAEPSPEIEGLARAAGAGLERLYDRQKKHTRARVADFVERAGALLDDQRKNPSLAKQVVLLASGSKTKSSNANTAILMNTLRDELGIPTVSSKMLAKTITQQVSRIVGLRPPVDGEALSACQAPATTLPAGTNRNDEPKTKTKASTGEGSQPSSSSEPRNTRSASQKRDREEVSTGKWERALVSDQVSDQNYCEEPANDFGANNDGEYSPERVSSESSTRHRKEQKLPPHRRSMHEEATRDDPAPPSSDPVALVKPTRAHQSTHGSTQLGRADANGWFTAAPRDDRERSKWRQRASDAYRSQTGVELERSASTDRDLRILVDVPNTAPSRDGNALATNRLRNRPTPSHLPDFKRFRKNPIARADPSQGVVLLTEALSASKRDQRELNAEEKELEEQQRLADALFRGEAIPSGTGHKRRRVRR